MIALRTLEGVLGVPAAPAKLKPLLIPKRPGGAALGVLALAAMGEVTSSIQVCQSGSAGSVRRRGDGRSESAQATSRRGRQA
jgi:hypothetical protein